MTSSAPSPEIDLSWQMREGEARLLAELMRTSRLTVLYGETTFGRTALLTGGVVPLLRRRETDTFAQTSRVARVVIPFPDRRSRQAGRLPTRTAELVVFFDAWSEEPSPGLRKCILEAVPTRAAVNDTSGIGLADMLETLGKRQDLQFLIVLDRFEELIAQDASVNERFIDEFCEAVNRSGLCANFMLSLSEDAKPQLEGLRRRIQGFDDFSVRLLRWNSVVKQPPLWVDMAPTGIAKSRAGRLAPVLKGAVETSPKLEPQVTLPADVQTRSSDKAARKTRAKLAQAAAGPHVPIETRAVYAFIESTLTQTAKATRLDPWRNVALDNTRVTRAPDLPKEREEKCEKSKSASGPLVGATSRETPPRDVMTTPARQAAPDHGNAKGAPASFANCSLNSALRWLERQIRPKP